jgi:hypothetical protein
MTALGWFCGTLWDIAYDSLRRLCGTLWDITYDSPRKVLWNTMGHNL